MDRSVLVTRLICQHFQKVLILIILTSPICEKLPVRDLWGSAVEEIILVKV